MSIAMPTVEHESPPFAGHETTENGRIRETIVADTERNYSMAIHLTLFATLIVLPPLGCLTPVILWLVRRDKSAFVDDHGRELTNVVITGAILTLTLGLIPIIGWIPLIVWYIVTGIGVVRGAIASSRGEYFRYPMTIRLVR